MSVFFASPQDFIAHWARAEANERANSQSFLLGLTQLLGVPGPSNSHYDGYSFEFPVKVPGGSSTNYIDLYRRGCFVLESKQFTAVKQEQTELAQVAPHGGTPGTVVTAGELAGRFARVSAGDLQEILETLVALVALVALGRARAVGERFGV